MKENILLQLYKMHSLYLDCCSPESATSHLQAHFPYMCFMGFRCGNKGGKKPLFEECIPVACQWQMRPSIAFDWHHSQPPTSEGTQINFHCGILLRTSRVPRLSRTGLRDKTSRNFKRMGKRMCISQANLWHTDLQGFVSMPKAGNLLAGWKSGVGSFKPCEHKWSLQTHAYTQKKIDYPFSLVF